jgi:hypothetical protein
MTSARRPTLIPAESDNRAWVRAILAVSAVTLGLAGCQEDRSSDPRPTDGAATLGASPAGAPTTGVVAPADTVAVARPGRKLVLPVTPGPGFVPGAAATVRLDDGPPLTGRLWWIGMTPPAWDQRVRGATDPIRAWLSESPGGAGGWGVWTATPGERVQPAETAGPLAAEAGQWIVVVDLPRDSKARRLWVGDAPSPGVPIVWWTGIEPQDMSPFAPGDAPMWVNSPWLARTLTAAASSPLTRWRAELVSAALGRSFDSFAPAEGPAPDPVLDVLAERMTSRWRAALVRLEAVDPALARRVLWTGAGVADFGGAVVAPLWTDDSAELAALIAGVLDPGISDTQSAQRAEAWLASRPPTLAWVIDDAGAPEPGTRRPVVTLGVLNRALTTEPAGVEPETARSAGVFAATPPLSARRVNVPVPGVEDGSATSTRLSVRMNERTLVRVATPSATPVTPPGLRVGPLVRDWTHSRFVAAAADPDPGPTELGVVDSEWSTAALLQRGVAAGTSERAGEWTLYVECRAGSVPGAPEPAGEPARDAVRLWLGPFGAPSLILRVTGEGVATVEDSHARAGTDWAALNSVPSGVTVRRLDSGWACWIPIPAGAVASDGTIRLALERTDPRGVRSAWPRAMLPWQHEPGRAWANLGAWEGNR